MAKGHRIEAVKVTYNWRQVNNGQTAGEDYDYFEVGYNGVKEIRPERNDQRLATVYFEDGSSMNINNLNLVYWKVAE